MAPTSAENLNATPPVMHLVLGTLSAVVGHPINGYLPMPDWATVQPDSSTREPPKEEPRSLARGGLTGDGKSGDGVDTGKAREFYYSGSSSPEYSSRSDSGSDSDEYDTSSSAASGGSESRSESASEEEGSDSGGSEGSAAGSESVSESGDEGGESGSSVGSGSSSTEDSSSYDSDSSSPSSQGEEGVGLLIMGPGATSSVGTSYGASAPAPHSQDLTGLVERMSVADREDSASPQPGPRIDRLNFNSLSMAGVRGSAAGLVAPGGSIGGGDSSALSMAGMAGAPDILSRSGSSTLSQHSVVDPELDTSMSFPSTLLRHQAGSGLQVEYRYMRGRVDVISRPTTVLTLRLTLSNHRDTPVRRIRVVAPRDGTPMNGFPEIQALGVGAMVDISLGIDFGGRAKEVSFCRWLW